MSGERTGESANGLYAYCVIDAGRSVPGDVTGVDGGALYIVEFQRLAVVVSEVALAVFGEQPLTEHLEDLRFLRRTAQAHDAVVFAAHAAGGACPLPLCTIFTGAPSVQAMLAREHDVLLSGLERVRGRDEWSVKVLIDPAAVEPTQPNNATGAGSPGRAFFERKRAERTTAERVSTAAGAAANEIHGALATGAAATTTLRTQPRAVSERDGEMALNGAYLIERERSEQFAELARISAERHRALGVHVALSGPFAPYSFVSEPPPRR